MEHRDDYQSEAAALRAIAGKLGCSPDSLRVWMRQIQRDVGERPGPTRAEIARIKELERENRELRQANEILRKGEPVKAPLVQAHWRTRILLRCERQCGTASALPVAARPPVPQMTAFIRCPAAHVYMRERGRTSRDVWAEPLKAPLVQAQWRRPICRTLQFAPSTYYDRRAIIRYPDLASARAKSDAALSVKIDAAWDANRKLYGARKIWHVLRRQGEDAARCTVERLMRSLGIRGVVRGKEVITTNPDTSLPCPDDKVNRLFKADRPNKLWVSDFTYVPTWSGTVYVAFVIDVFARRIVGLRDLPANPFRVTAGAPRHP